jgi:hypothetical protein
VIVRTVLALLFVAPAVTSLRAQVVEVYRPVVRELGGVTDSTPRDTMRGRRLCQDAQRIRTFERGFLDLYSSGVGQASTELVRLCIGEEGILQFPLYLMAGTTGAVSEDPDASGAAAGTLLSPTGGTLQLTTAKTFKLWAPPGATLTRFEATYGAAGRYLTLSGRTLVVGHFSGGVRFQTGAWELHDPSKAGVAWVQFGTSFIAAPEADLAAVFGGPVDALWTITAEAGIHIDGRINLRGGLYRAIGNEDLAGFDDPQFRFGVDFRGR